MKKIISYLFIISILSTMLFSNISKHNELIEKYLDVSGQGYMFSTIPSEMAQMLEQQFAAVGGKVPQEVESIVIEEFTRQSTVNKLTEELNKLSDDTLEKLIVFYNTDVGKKAANMNRNEGMEDMQTKLPDFLQNMQTNPPSKHRIESMNTMFQETNAVTGTLSMIESMIRIFNASLPQEQQMSEEQLKETLLNMNVAMAQQLIVTFYYALRDFTDNEVDEIVKVTLSDEGQAETDAQIAGLTAYADTATKNIIKSLKKQ